MITVIYGGRGSGKTTKLVESANAAALTAKGIVAYIDKGKERMHDLDHAVKLVNAEEFKISSLEEFTAFIKGMVAGNYDIQTLFIDNAEKITKRDVFALSTLFDSFDYIAKNFKVNFVLTVNCEKEKLPDFLKKYV
jgi:thymidine kinase